MERKKVWKYKNTRKFEIEEAKYNDGTYQFLRIFARSCKVVIIQQTEALKKGYMKLEYERDGKPSGIANMECEFFAINFDIRDRFFIIRAELLRIKARRYYKIDEHFKRDGVRYVKVPTTEIISWE